MLTQEQLDDLYDESYMPYTDEELKLHQQNRTVKSELEIEHAYNYELIMQLQEWIGFLNGNNKSPTTAVWHAVRPAKNLVNDRCT